MDGMFHLLIFDKKKVINNVNLSEMMGRTDYIRPNDNLPYPMMDACFIDNTHIMGQSAKMTNNKRIEGLRVFVNMFITRSNEIISFIYDFYTNSIVTTQNVT